MPTKINKSPLTLPGKYAFRLATRQLKSIVGAGVKGAKGVAGGIRNVSQAIKDVDKEGV